MKEERFEIKPYGVRYICNCGGEMIQNGITQMTYPPRYLHKCTKCGLEIYLTERYPDIKWETT